MAGEVVHRVGYVRFVLDCELVFLKLEDPPLNAGRQGRGNSLEERDKWLLVNNHHEGVNVDIPKKVFACPPITSYSLSICE